MMMTNVHPQGYLSHPIIWNGVYAKVSTGFPSVWCIAPTGGWRLYKSFIIIIMLWNCSILNLSMTIGYKCFAQVVAVGCLCMNVAVEQETFSLYAIYKAHPELQKFTFNLKWEISYSMASSIHAFSIFKLYLSMFNWCSHSSNIHSWFSSHVFHISFSLLFVHLFESTCQWDTIRT